MIEETEEPVQIHVGRTFQKVLLQRVLEVVDSFIRILQKVILEDCLVQIGISCESAFEQRSSLGCFHRSDCHPVVHELFTPAKGFETVFRERINRPNPTNKKRLFKPPSPKGKVVPSAGQTRTKTGCQL